MWMICIASLLLTTISSNFSLGVMPIYLMKLSTLSMYRSSLFIGEVGLLSTFDSVFDAFSSSSSSILPGTKFASSLLKHRFLLSEM
jgi:hypothetical protein